MNPDTPPQPNNQPQPSAQPSAQVHYPDGYTPPTPPPQPTASANPPAAAPATAPASPAPTPWTGQIGVSGSSLGDLPQPKKKRRWVKWLFIIPGALIVVAIAVLVSVGAYSQTLHPTTYQNSKGESYKLNYYPFSTTTKVYTDLNAGLAPNKQVNDLFLVGPPQGPVAFRLALSIAKNGTDPQLNATKRPSICTANTFTVQNAATGFDSPVCAITSNGKPIFYIFSVKTVNNYYVGTIFYNYRQPGTPQQARAIVAAADLRNSQSDIKKIIASIQPQ